MSDAVVWDIVETKLPVLRRSWRRFSEASVRSELPARELEAQFAESARLEAEIRERLTSIS